MNNKEGLCYLAGFFDGEGSIGLYWNKAQKIYVPIIQVSNTNKTIIKELQDKFGGYVNSRQRKASYKLIWDWNIRDGKKRIPYFIETMTPYLRQKKEEAKTLMEFCNTLTKGGKTITPKLQAYRKKLAEELKSLKRR